MENPENLSPEELVAKKEEMLKFYKESMPYLQAQFDYEELLSQIDEMRLKRTQIQMTYAQMMAPPEEEDDTMPQPEESSKKRKLKKEA
jgi:hypothetical protein